MKTIWIWLVIAALLGIGFAIYRSGTSTGDLKVEPHAGKEIEKAKRR
jgi:hypothetical protein